MWKIQTFPNSWRFAHILPILKGGGNPGSAIYRPIVLTCCLRNVMERCVNSRLLDFLNYINLLIDDSVASEKDAELLINQ